MKTKVYGLRELNPNECRYDPEIFDDEVIRDAAKEQVRVFEVVTESGWQTFYVVQGGGKQGVTQAA